MRYKILFVCSGNSKYFDVSPFIKRQADSLIRIGNQVDIFRIEEGGILGYLKHILLLYKKINNESSQYDIIHAHYTLSGWVAFFAAMNKTKVLTYMGTDAYGLVNNSVKDYFVSFLLIIQGFAIQYLYEELIFKSKNLLKNIFLKKNVNIIPNGVNLQEFRPIQKEECRIKLGIESNKRILLFVGDVKSKRKNFKLLKDSLKFLKTDCKVLSPYPVKPELMPLYYNASDVLVFTSLKEGSPNVIKEAMACNLPIVTTIAGDVQWIIGETEGCFISSFDHKDLSIKIESALHFSNLIGKTKGRERIIDLGLNSESIAKRLVTVYKRALK
ncbi:MAG: glycosyltransferase family 4 protein [Cyclobacteriaceae bacterium]